MDAHRRMMQRRQRLTRDPFPFSSTSSTTSTFRIPTNDPLPPTTVINRSSSTSSPSSTFSPTSRSSLSTFSSSSSLSSSSSSSSVTPPPPRSTSSATSVNLSQRPSLPTSSFTLPKLTSITSTPSSTPTGTSGNASGTGATVPTGAIVGGIAAGILGLAGIFFAVLYFIRRMKKKNENTFDADVFRRQSRVLHDEPQVLPDDDNPFAPRPPTMIERRMNSTPVLNVGGSTYGPGPVHGGYNDHNAGYNRPGPGQAIPHSHSYGDSYMESPMSAPMSPPMSVNHGDVGAEQSQSAYLSRQPPTHGPAPADNSGHYIDLSRSSVTPFQAAQYEEIHRRLNIPPPAPVLGSFAEEEYPPKEPTPKGPSPFADPSENVLPPPSPVHSNRSRVDSNPPKLPELTSPMSPVYALHPVSAGVPDKQIEASTPDLPAAPAPAHVAHPNPSTPNRKRPDTVYTIYDNDDAYAGI